MAHAIDDLKMVHEEEMKNYDRIESAVVSVMRRHGCKIIQTPTLRITIHTAPISRSCSAR